MPADFGHGPGAITADGCAVDLYAMLPAMGEPELIDTVLPPGSTIFELGSGAGRITHPLLALGHQVVAVDNSREMLAHIRGAEVVLADIETLDLCREFDAVLLASHFVNVPDEGTRTAMLRTCRRHVGRWGRVLVQWSPPASFDGLVPGQPVRGSVGPARRTLHPISFARGVLRATVRYQVDDAVWEQTFTSRRLTSQELAAALRAADLEFERFIGGDESWLLARVPH